MLSALACTTLINLEVRREGSEEDERCRAAEVEKPNHKSFHHELIARLWIEEHYLPCLRIGVVPNRTKHFKHSPKLVVWIPEYTQCNAVGSTFAGIE